jgi:hypothetical protein
MTLERPSGTCRVGAGGRDHPTRARRWGTM